MHNKLFIALCLVFLVVLAYLFRSLYLPGEQATVAEITTSGTVALSLSPASVSNTPGSSVDITVNVNAGSSLSTGVAAELSYDPAFLQVISVTQGSFYPEVLQAATFGNGKVSFTYGVSPSAGGKSGSGQVAVIKVKLLKSGSGTLSFNNSTLATVIGVGNALKSLTGTSLSASGRSDIFPDGGDGTVNILDYNLVVSKFGQTGAPGFTPADIERDGKINILDYNYLVTDFGKNY